LTSREKTEYRKSRHWRERRAAVIERDGKRCAFCVCKITGKVHVHHVTEDDYCADGIENLVVMCPACHSYISKKFERRRDWSEVTPPLRELLSRVLRNAATNYR
jgi:5-methylcytosine-specific restriction endonuclease McrA